MPRSGEGHYTQVNIMFPSTEVELPSADKFNAFPPDAQKAILIAFRSEQQERHAWLKRQQANDHELNTRSQIFSFSTKLAGTIGAAVIVSIMIAGGIWLVKAGASAWGVSLIIAAISGLVGTAIYGHRNSQAQKQEPPPKSGPPTV